MNKNIPTPIYIICKKLNNIKLSDIKILDANKKNNSILYKAGEYIIKPETDFFLKEKYPAIKKLYTLDKNYIPNYKNFKYQNHNYFYYKYIDGNKFYNYIYKFKFKNNKVLINNLINFIKFYITIDTKIFDKNTLKSNRLVWDFNFLKNSSNVKFTKLLENNLKRIYDISIKKQKNTNKKLLLFEDLNTHNILIDKNNNIKLIDMSEGLIVGNYNLYLHRYFSLIWSLGEKAVDKAIIECNINNNSTLVKELSFVYFCKHHILANDLFDNYFDRLKSFFFKI